ncbi:MAG: GTP cyclohydrolase II [Cirrosporium novae-zelandiae]|nr:MAG: GTP cyclohydrolase II [Cirrosporium novae-zelandiae]
MTSSSSSTNSLLDIQDGSSATDSVSNTAGTSTPPSSTSYDSLSLPASLISPQITPPSTPGGTFRTSTPLPIPIAHTTPLPPAHNLLPKLPKVDCIVRARIPTTDGAEMFLHLYRDNVDSKEHLAIVFGSHIRSRSLDAVRPGETEMDRMIRGAYIGRLRPGRTSSRIDDTQEPKVKSSQNQPESQSQQQKSQKTNLQASSDAFPSDEPPPLVRIHSECYTGETAWSARCDCGEQLDEAAHLMAHPSSLNPYSSGVIIYLRQEGRGIGLSEKLKAYNLQDLGSDTVEANLILRHPADARSYGLATSMLVDLGLGGEKGIRLLTNNPEKVRAVEGPGREVVVKERVPMVPLAWRTNGKRGVHGRELEEYLRTKVSAANLMNSLKP